MSSHSVITAHLQLALYALLISTAFPIAAALGQDYPPVLTTWFRFLIAALGFALLLRLQNRLHWPGWRSVGRYALISFPITGFFLLMFVSGETASALHLGGLYTGVPIASLILGHLIWKTPLSKQRLLALFLGALAALWVMTEGHLSRLAGDWPLGNSIFLLACLLMAVYPMVLRSLYRSEPMMVITGWSMVTGCFWLTLAILVMQPQLSLPTYSQWQLIIWLAIGTTMFTFFLFKSASIVVGGGSAHAYGLLTPVLVIGINAYLEKPLPSLWVIPGIAMIFICLLWILYLDRQHPL